MTDARPRRQKITVVASVEGIERANKALLRHGHDSIAGYAKKSLVSRTTITKFFKQQSIQVDSFKQICQELQLDDWQSIVQASTPSAAQQVEATNLTSMVDATLQHPSKKPARQVTLSDPATGRKVVIVLEGDESSINNELKIILQLALQNRGITVKITDLESGSIRVSAEGSQDDITRLIELVQSRELTELAEYEIKEVQVFQESLDDIEEDEDSDKWRLIEDIKKSRTAFPFSSHYADLSGANLQGADLRSANLIDADLRRADLRRANLNGADLRHAILRGADLRGAILSNVNLRGTVIDEETQLDDKWHLVWRIVNKDTEGIILIGADLSDADISGANLSDANLIGANLSGANLRGANLIDADLRRADLRRADLRRANLNGADLSGVGLSGAALRRANLIGANLIGANLSDANLSDAILRGADLSDADLRRANLSDADISDANLSSANVLRSIFTNALGISESLKQDLIRRGAIFEDSPGDRSGILSPR